MPPGAKASMNYYVCPPEVLEDADDLIADLERALVLQAQGRDPVREGVAGAQASQLGHPSALGHEAVRAHGLRDPPRHQRGRDPVFFGGMRKLEATS